MNVCLCMHCSAIGRRPGRNCVAAVDQEAQRTDHGFHDLRVGAQFAAADREALHVAACEALIESLRLLREPLAESRPAENGGTQVLAVGIGLDHQAYGPHLEPDLALLVVERD